MSFIFLLPEDKEIAYKQYGDDWYDRIKSQRELIAILVGEIVFNVPDDDKSDQEQGINGFLVFHDWIRRP